MLLELMRAKHWHLLVRYFGPLRKKTRRPKQAKAKRGRREKGRKKKEERRLGSLI